MNNVKFKIVTKKDVEIIKRLINQMYGVEYEVRENVKIAEAIDNKTEFYVLAYVEDKCVGFSGASLNNDYYADVITPDIAVIDYIYTEEGFRNISTSFQLIGNLLKELVAIGVKQAIMQVQTYNKYRFFHYALSDKNIIKSTTLEKNGNVYEDQILLIKDLQKVLNMSIKELMIKVHRFGIEEKTTKTK